jgi:DNA-binding NtrC family response regulator
MGSTLEVLLVDDEEIVGKRLKPALDKKGYSVEVLRDGRSAIERLKQKTFDIVVTDIRMDEVDGLGVLEAVQQSSPGTKTIMITGYARADVVREAQLKGAFEVIAKPFRPKDLLEILERAAREIGEQNPK